MNMGHYQEQIIMGQYSLVNKSRVSNVLNTLLHTTQLGVENKWHTLDDNL